jgi:GDP-4-dehydro-6-deoxy-D-mannose reductase
MRALVTGAGGFVGKRVSAVLREAGIDVVELGRSVAGCSKRIGLGPAPWPARRLADALAQVQPDLIFHLAGTRDGEAEVLREINVGLCQSLLQAVTETGLRPAAVLAAGSAAEYGNALMDGEPAGEGLACRPAAAYGATKLAQTEALAAFAEKTGVRSVSARLFGPIGVGMPAHLALGGFARQIDACPGRGELVVGDIDVARDFLPVDATARAMVALALNPDARGVTNVCSGAPTGLRRLVEIMIARSGKDIRIRIDPARLRPGEPRVIYGDAARLASFGVAVSADGVEAVAGQMVARAENRIVAAP